MKIKKQAIGEYTIYHLTGSFDFNSIDFVLSDITEPANKKIIIDINDLNRIDSTGYGTLIKLWKTVTFQKGEFHLLCSNRKFLDKLAELNLTRILHIFHDISVLDEAKTEKADMLAKVKVAQVENFKVISFQEPLKTLLESAQFRDYLLSQINEGNIFMALDFSNVNHIYSELLSAILKGKSLIDAKDGRLVFIGVKEELYGIFECMGVAQLFIQYPDLKAFTAALKGKSMIKRTER
jgi:anti-anti-sigma factor